LRPRGPSSARRRLFAATLIAAVAVLLVVAGPALADAITPESGGSPNADRIDTLYKLVLYVAIVVFVGVEGALIYSLVKFRASRGAVPAQIRGNTNLELAWTVGAAVIVVVLTVITFVKLPSIKDPDRTGASGLASLGGNAIFAATDQPKPPGGKSLQIDVNGQQYVWRFIYPGKVFAYEEMVVPINTTVTLRIRSQDVAHSWWIPKLGGKMDAIPGYTNKTWFKITEPGTYDGQCAELCGRNHANMLARVRAVPVAEYEAWIARQKKAIAKANNDAAADLDRLSPAR
jgi:cytochrome c oxidase subunit 2